MAELDLETQPAADTATPATPSQQPPRKTSMQQLRDRRAAQAARHHRMAAGASPTAASPAAAAAASPHALLQQHLVDAKKSVSTAQWGRAREALDAASRLNTNVVGTHPGAQAGGAPAGISMSYEGVDLFVRWI